jgi:hypothetical protein
MFHRSTRVLSLAAVIASGAAAAPALAANPNLELLVSRHVATVESQVDMAHTRMVMICERTVNVVNVLDSRNVANTRISVTGSRGMTQIDALGNKIEVGVVKRTNALLVRLQRLNADQSLIDQVNAALAAAQTELALSEAQTKAPIEAAVATATSN